MSTQPGDGGRGGEGLEINDVGNVRVLTLNRPSAANAFDRALYLATEQALRHADHEESVSVVVLTGGGRHFSSGTDLVEMAAMVEHLDDVDDVDDDADGDDDDEGEKDTGPHPFSEFSKALLSLRKPLLAAVNGTGIGLGFTLLLHCDIVCIARDARLRAPFTAMGVAPEAGSSYLMPRRMGFQQAALVLFSSSWVSAEQAVASGLALKVCDPATLLDETLEIAREIAQHPLPSLIATKELLRQPEREAVERAMNAEEDAFALLLKRPQASAGVLSQLTNR